MVSYDTRQERYIYIERGWGGKMAIIIELCFEFVIVSMKGQSNPSFGQNTGLQKKLDTICKQNAS